MLTAIESDCYLGDLQRHACRVTPIEFDVQLRRSRASSSTKVAGAHCVTLGDIEQAAVRIGSHIIRTPILRREVQGEGGRKRRLFLKCEHLQCTGSFKARGAYNAALQLPDGCRAVVTHSSGNHAAALAWACSLIPGTSAHCVVPKDAPPSKVSRALARGAQLVRCPPSQAAREEGARRLIHALGGELVHSSNDCRVIAGQGTVALELLDQVDDIDAVIVPVGGGGLLAGVAAAVKARSPGVRVIGAEPVRASSAARSLAAGRLVKGGDLPVTLADGLRTSLGGLTWPIVRDLVDKIVTVSELDIAYWTKVAWEMLGVPVEPSAAVALAAAMSDIDGLHDGSRVAVILTGGNVDPSDVYKIGIGVGT
jgi:threonine dehydratase